MSALLVAVKSSFEMMERGGHDAARATWVQSLRGKAYIKFFIGRDVLSLDRSVTNTARNSYSPKGDEVILDCRDDDQGLVQKTRAICQYVVGKSVSHVLMLNVDSYPRLKQIEESNYLVADYAGVFNGTWGDVSPREVRGPNEISQTIERCYSWADGSFGYFLSLQAAFEIADTAPKSSHYGAGCNDDLWVGQVLGPLCERGELISMPLQVPVCEAK